MHGKAYTIGGMQHEATDDTIAWPVGSDRLRRRENQRMLSNVDCVIYGTEMV